MMKRYIFLYFSLIALLFSCEDVVEVDLDDISPRLVVEADIEWERGQDGSMQTIQLSQSTSFFDESHIPVIDASVSIEKLNSGEVFEFTHDAEGIYETNNFIPELGAEYQLNIIHNNQTYQATERLMSVTPVTRVEQNTEPSFDEGEEVSIDFYTQDPVDIENYYFVEYKVNGLGPNYLLALDDEFQDGNEMVFIFRPTFYGIDYKLETGDEVLIEFTGIDEDFFKYAEILIEQAYGGGDPFATTPVQLKGNVANLTTNDENAFGFFRVSEKETFTVVVE